jgi:hypothetical protein
VMNKKYGMWAGSHSPRLNHFVIFKVGEVRQGEP